MLRTGKYTKAVLILSVLAVCCRSSVAFAWEEERREHREHSYRDHDRYGMRINFISSDYVPIVAQGARYYYHDGAYYVFTGNAYMLVTPPVGAVVSMIPAYYSPVVINGVVYYTDRGIYYVNTGYGYQVVPPPVVQAIQEPVYVRQTVEVAPEPQNQTKVAEGSVLGGILGALTGGIIGHQMKGHHELGGALLGGVAGAAAGGIMGAQIPNENANRPVTVEQVVPVAPAPQSVPTPTQNTPEGTFIVNVPDGHGGYIPVKITKSGNGFVGPQGEFYSEFPKVSQLQAMYSK